MDFNPALPLAIKWTISDDRFHEGGQVLSLTIPVDSVTHLVDHLQNLVNTKSKDGDVYDHKTKDTIKTQYIQIYSKVMEGKYGPWGNINPQKIENAPNTNDLPF